LSQLSYYGQFEVLIVSHERILNFVTDLIFHLSIVVFLVVNSDGLCYQLTKACPKEPEVIPFKDIELDRKEIESLRKLGAGQFGEVYAGILSDIFLILHVWLKVLVTL
jgi:hypothetical protein